MNYILKENIWVICVGSLIGITNIMNRKSSPIYDDNPITKIRLTLVTGVKTIIYSWAWPISLVCVTIDSLISDNKEFSRHFIPCSVYYQKHDRRDSDNFKNNSNKESS